MEGISIIFKSSVFTQYKRKLKSHSTTCSKCQNYLKVRFNLNLTVTIQSVIVNMLLYKALTQNQVIAVINYFAKCCYKYATGLKKRLLKIT